MIKKNVEERVSDFKKWSFGTDKFLSSLKMVEEWNKRHGDKLTIRLDDTIIESLIKMYEYYWVCRDEFTSE
jgi:hypothetical protein